MLEIINKIIIKLQSELHGDMKSWVLLKEFRLTPLSVMPCRLNGDVHEWFNEVVTVPNQDLLNPLTGENAGDA